MFLHIVLQMQLLLCAIYKTTPSTSVLLANTSGKLFLQIDNYECGLCVSHWSWYHPEIAALYSLQGGFPCLGEMVNWSCSVLVSNGLWYDKEHEMWSRSTSLASQHMDHHHICIALVSNGQWYGKEREGNIVISGRTLNWPTLMNAKYIMYDR